MFHLASLVKRIAVCFLLLQSFIVPWASSSSDFQPRNTVHFLLFVHNDATYKTATSLKESLTSEGFLNITVLTPEGASSPYISIPTIIFDAMDKTNLNEWVMYINVSTVASTAVTKPAVTHFVTEILPMLFAASRANVAHMCECIPIVRSPSQLQLSSMMSMSSLSTFVSHALNAPEIPCDHFRRWSVTHSDVSLWRNTYESRMRLQSWIKMIHNASLIQQIRNIMKSSHHEAARAKPSIGDILASLFVAKYNLKTPLFETSHLFHPSNTVETSLKSPLTMLYPHEVTISTSQLNNSKSAACASTNTNKTTTRTTPKTVAICLTGHLGSSARTVLESWRKNVFDVLHADFFVVSPGWPSDIWLEYTGIHPVAVMNDDIDIVPFFDAHAPRWRQSRRGDNYLNGLPGFEPGSGAFQIASRYHCSQLINASEAARGGLKYDFVGIGRWDLMWPSPHPSVEALIQAFPGYFNHSQVVPGGKKTAGSCWIPCLRNNWGGVCDQYAFCDRDDASAATMTGLLDVLPLANSANTEKHLGHTINHFGVNKARSDVNFIRTCEDPNVSGKPLTSKCGYASKLGVYGKVSGGQLDFYNG